MAKFIRQALVSLDKVFGFDQGPTATDHVNLAAGVQLVHNVSREAEIASGVGKAAGWFDFQSVISHAGAGSLDSTFQIQVTAQATGLYDPYRHDLWWFDTTAQIVLAGPGTFTSAFEYSTGEPLQSGQLDRVLKAWTGERASATTRFGIDSYAYPRPVQLFFPGALIVRSTVAAGALDIIANHICWIGAKGVLPPHVA